MQIKAFTFLLKYAVYLKMIKKYRKIFLFPIAGL